MTDPQLPENLPERPPLPPRATVPQAEQPRGADPQAAQPASEPQPGYPTQQATPHRTSTPPPNPYGQTGRHAPAPAPQQRSEFAPPSSPGFGPQGAPVGSAPSAPPQQYGHQAPPQQQFGQHSPPAQQYGQHNQGQQYGRPAYPVDGATTAPSQQYPTAAPVPAAKPARPASRLATTGVVLGSIGILGGIIFGWTLPLSIVAIVLGFIARSKEPHARGIALAAIVTGILGLLLSAGWLAYSIITWLALTAS